MNENNKKNNLKILFIIMPIIFVVLIIIVFAISNKTNLAEKMIVKCDRVVNVENRKFLFEFEVYKSSNELKLIQKSAVNLDVNIKEDLLENLIKYYKTQQQEKIEAEFGKNFNYIENSISYNNKKINLEIIYHINKESEEKMFKVLEYDFINATKEEISDYFEKEGYSCKIY